MRSEFIVRENFRCLKVWQPSCILNACSIQCLLSMIRISYAINFCLQLQLLHGFYNELMQLLCSFIIPPVSDPDKITFLLIRSKWLEHTCVCSFVPCPHVFCPSLI